MKCIFALSLLASVAFAADEKHDTPTATPVVSVEYAEIPYAIVHNLFRDSAGISSPHLHPSVTIHSSHPDVTPGQIALTMLAAAGPVTLTLLPNGELQDFPMTDELLAENPVIETNQPKGSIVILSAVAVQLPDALHHTGAELRRLLAEGNAAMKKQAGPFDATAPQGTGFIFEFPRGSQPALIVTESTGPKTLAPDPEGKFHLPIDANTGDLTVSEKPVRVIIDVPKE
ncbi:MAG: hypothetical protein M3Y03_02155 [Verrucomicrobiota bacterium]|nr:hypothetical protein [Verrucomicrobiota bacterium]